MQRADRSANGGFEQPGGINAFKFLDQSDVEGWSTTEPDGQIELWHTGYLDVPAAEGQQFAELSANEPASCTRSERPCRERR